MEMVAHQTEAEDGDIEAQNTDGDVVHSCNKVLFTLEDVVFLQPVAAYVIVSLHIFRFIHFLSPDLPEISAAKL